MLAGTEPPLRQEHPILVAVSEFQSWLLDLRRSQLANTEGDPHVVRIDEQVARRFCVGVAENRVFLGVQARELCWFQGMPWLHVALRKGSQNINVVSEQTTVQGVTLPYFAIALRADNREKISLLSKYHYLDVREIEAGPQGEVLGVSCAITMTLTVALVEQDETIEDLLARRGGKSFTNRSVFRKASK